MNPWISIWLEPRKTIAMIVAENPNRAIWALAWIYGFLSMLNGSQSLSLGNQVHFIPILIFAIVIAPIWGMLIFGIWSWVVLAVGKILKGQATFAAARAAFAWSCVPLIVNIALWALLLWCFGGSLFQTAHQTGPVGLLMVVLIAKVVIAIWSLVIYINALAAVQKFSIGRSILNIVLAWLAIGIAVILIWMGIAALFNAALTPSQAVFNLTLRMQL